MSEVMMRMARSGARFLFIPGTDFFLKKIFLRLSHRTFSTGTR